MKHQSKTKMQHFLAIVLQVLPIHTQTQ